MSSVKAKRAELVQAVGAAGRDLSAHTVMFHSAVAHKLGLGPTDHKAFDYPSIVASFPLVVDTRNALKGIKSEKIVAL